MVPAEGESLGRALTMEIAPADNPSLPGHGPNFIIFVQNQ